MLNKNTVFKKYLNSNKRVWLVWSNVVRNMSVLFLVVFRRHFENTACFMALVIMKFRKPENIRVHLTKKPTKIQV